jgi:hypothetical protein
MLVDYQQFECLFLDPDSLRNVFVYLCNKSFHCVGDPITATILTMICTDLQVNITETGIALFKNHHTCVYPFSVMNDRQREWVRQTVSECAECCRHLTYTRSITGGSINCIFRPPLGPAPVAPDRVRKINPTSVLTAFCDAVMRSTGITNLMKTTICNIVLQRVSTAVHIDRRTVQKLNEYMQQRVQP